MLLVGKNMLPTCTALLLLLLHWYMLCPTHMRLLQGGKGARKQMSAVKIINLMQNAKTLCASLRFYSLTGCPLHLAFGPP